MLFASPLTGISEFLEAVLSHSTGSNGKNVHLSQTQFRWIGICMSAMILMGMFCFARIQRSSAGVFSARALSWMLHSSKIEWDQIFEGSVLRLINLFGVQGFLVIDDSDRTRAKGTKTLFGIQKLRDKKTGGYSTGQNLVVLLFVTKKMTFPVGVRFFQPDPQWVKWRENDRKLRLQGVPARLRPKRPDRSSDYPTKITIACELIQRFRSFAPEAEITSINADAAFSCTEFTRGCEKLYPGVQVISQIRSNQLVKAANQREKSVSEYFSKQSSVTTKIVLRGKREQEIHYASARLKVKSQGRTLHIIALKYSGEAEYRYITASNLTWKGLDVVRAYSTRWLIEVFFQDWKMYDGWGKSACQRGFEGARRGVILSLLVDHFLLSHPLQLARVKAGIAAFTAGSLQRYMQSRAILDSVTQILELPDPREALRELYQSIERWVEFRPSDKHMTGRELEECVPSPSLTAKFKHRK